MEGYEKQGTLYDMFERQAKLTPDKVAVIEATGKQMTFAELDRAVDILAKNLLIKGVKPDTCVGIYLDKCLDFTISYIAILKAGGAYLPLDISYPDLLLKSILEDSSPVAVVTHSSLATRVEGVKNVVVLEDGWIEKLGKENPAVEEKPQSLDVTLDNLAYIVYSSGTTGKPKGIACPHRGAVFSYHARHIYYPYTDSDREACNVFFVWEMLRPLLKGIPMYIIPSTVIYDPTLLCHFLHDNEITRILFTPSLLEAVLNTVDLNIQHLLKSLRTIFFCGEVVTTALFERCLKILPEVQFINLYSVSECHDVANENLNDYFRDNKDALTSRKFCPVGRVIPGVQIAILNEDLKPQPVGASGEIYIGGPTLARGYVNRPEVQVKRFIPRPETVSPVCGPVLYRSGDWGYMLSDGSLEICGRCDSMVKIRGYSIEIQAVEVALMELSCVQACVVLAKGAEGEDKFLVAYIVPKEQATKKNIRAALKRRLPFYMIPSFFVFLTKIPVVQATGKLDKAALPPFDKETEDEAASEGRPSTETEVTLATIWSKILQIKEVDIMESFFDLGGHSLMATQLMTQLNSTFDLRLAVQELFSYPTIASLAKLVDAKLAKDDKQAPAVVKETLNLVDEVNKHDQGIVNIDMQLRAFWRTFAFYDERRFVKGRVLLTGATGFLGVFLLRELLLQTRVFVFCLIRELPDVTPAQRLRKTIQQYGMLPPDGADPSEEQKQLEQLISKRVRPIKGNVALINLGISEEEYTYVCTDVDFIIHAAATVNLIYPYTALHGPNVLGTSNVILFACTGKIKPVHFISTDAVFPEGMRNCLETDDTAGYHTQLHDGYSQSKWVAEQLVHRAGQRGVPVTIYRLGNMSGDQSSAHWNRQDFTLAMLKACCELELAPDVDWDVEMTPVDFAASFVVKMAKKSSSSIGKTFHIINDRPLKSRWIFEWMNANGYPVQVIPFQDWKTRVMEQKGGDSAFLQSVVDSYIRDETFFTQLSTYRCDCFHDNLAQLGVTYPYTDSKQLSTYFSKLSEMNIFQRRKPKSLHHLGSALQDKVAIVTGASSGIGKAIAITLASAGAKVAMAARRIELLQEVESAITKMGNVCICVKTDVTNRAEVKELVRHTEMTLGPVDILVNNAGTMYYTMMKNLHEDEWERQIDVNIKGLTNCIGAVLDGMLKRGKGHIVNMSSDAGRKGFPGLAVYSGTKFYVEGLSQALRQEVCGSGLRVTCIQPGDVKTELVTHTTDTEAQKAYDGSGNCKILQPEDIANAVLYAVTQPEYVGVNEILIEPREAPV